MRVNYDLENGQWNYIDRRTDKVVIQNAYAIVKLNTLYDKDWAYTFNDYEKSYKVQEINDQLGSGKEVTFIHENLKNKPDILIKLRIYDNKPFCLLSASINNCQNDNFTIQAICLIATDYRHSGALYLGSEPTGWRVLEHAPTSWRQENVRKIVDNENTKFISCDRCSIVNIKTSFALTVGSLTINTKCSPGRFIVKGYYSSVHQASQLYEGLSQWEVEEQYLFSNSSGLVLSKGSVFNSNKLFLSFGSPFEVLEGYTHVHSVMNAVQINPDIPKAWIALYKYFDVDESIVLKHAEFIANYLKQYEVQYIVVDLGWSQEEYWSDWTNDSTRFPHGMEWLAAQIKKIGLRPGLWVAPFVVLKNSKLYQSHPEYLVKDPKSSLPLDIHRRMWGTEVCVLDVTHPMARNWLRSLFMRLVKWGYEYLKVDFTDIHYVRGVRHNSNITMEQVYVLGQQTIKEAVGNKARVLTTGGLLTYNVGIADCQRITCDLHGWQSIRREAMDIACRYYMIHPRSWIAHCGELIMGPDMSDDQARIWATVVGISGGVIDIAECFLPNVNWRKLEYYVKCLPTDGNAAMPVDLFCKEDVIFDVMPPRIWDLKINCAWGKWDVVGLFNWRDTNWAYRVTTLNFVDLGLDNSKEYLIYGFWKQEFLGIQKRGVSLPLGRCSCEVIMIKEKTKYPWVLSTDMHIRQGDVELTSVHWDSKRKILSGECNSRYLWKNKGSIIIFVPAKYIPRDFKSTIHDVVLKQTEVNIWRLSFVSSTLPKSIFWKINFFEH